MRRRSTVPISRNAPARIRRRPARVRSSVSNAPAKSLRLADGVTTHRSAIACARCWPAAVMPNVVNVPAGQALRIPRGLTFEQAAALPEVFATAYLNLFMEARLARGRTRVVACGCERRRHGRHSARAMNDSPCFVTAGSDDKVARCMALGASGRGQSTRRLVCRSCRELDRRAGLRRHSRSGRRGLSESQSAQPAHSTAGS